jgi:hypothetical protein
MYIPTNSQKGSLFVGITALSVADEGFQAESTAGGGTTFVDVHDVSCSGLSSGISFGV